MSATSALGHASALIPEKFAFSSIMMDTLDPFIGGEPFADACLLNPESDACIALKACSDVRAAVTAVLTDPNSNEQKTTRATKEISKCRKALADIDLTGKDMTGLLTSMSQDELRQQDTVGDNMCRKLFQLETKLKDESFSRFSEELGALSSLSQTMCQDLSKTTCKGCMINGVDVQPTSELVPEMDKYVETTNHIQPKIPYKVRILLGLVVSLLVVATMVIGVLGCMQASGGTAAGEGAAGGEVANNPTAYRSSVAEQYMRNFRNAR